MAPRNPAETTGITRRRFLAKASALGALPGIAMTTASCSPNGDFESTARTIRRPLRESAEPGALLQELVRCATLAPNGHNTQPWLFELAQDRISIRPDFSRRTPVVDPDDHHVWVSLGCAAENMVIAAAALGLGASFVDGKRPAIDFLPIQGGDRRLRLLAAGHLDKAEAF